MDLIIINEAWRSVDGFLNYQVSNIGNVRNANNGKILKPQLQKGYLHVRLSDDSKQTTCSIHRLVAKAFIVNPENKPQVDHVDNNKVNNSANNLRWATAQENSRNQPKTSRTTTSKYIGVHWHKQHQTWHAKMRVHGKTTHIGYFSDPKDAARAYNERLIGLATTFGVLNEISDNEISDNE